MNKYSIEAKVIEYHAVDIEADSEEEAIEKATEYYFDTSNAYETKVEIDEVMEIEE